MSSRTLLLALLVVSLSAIGCTKAKITRAPGGVLRLDCGRGMRDCVAQAEKHCNVQKKDEGYVILSGTSRKVMMGSKDGQYRTAAEVANLEVRCGAGSEADDLEVVPTTIHLPTRKDAPVVAEDLPPPTQSTAGVCTKGSTQACIGPGACQGGQSCLPDGSGYGACDCGGGTSADGARGAGTAAPKDSLAPKAPGEGAPRLEPGAGAEPLAN